MASEKTMPCLNCLSSLCLAPSSTLTQGYAAELIARGANMWNDAKQVIVAAGGVQYYDKVVAGQIDVAGKFGLY